MTDLNKKFATFTYKEGSGTLGQYVWTYETLEDAKSRLESLKQTFPKRTIIIAEIKELLK